jgi:hypothetical protein
MEMIKEKIAYEFTLEISGDNFDAEKCDEYLNLKATDIWRQKIKELTSRKDLPNMVWSYSKKIIKDRSQDETAMGHAAIQGTVFRA